MIERVDFAWRGSSFTVVAIREDKLGVRHASRYSDNNQNDFKSA